MSMQSDIIVAGAGPAGLSLCRSLADSRLTITVITPHSAEELENPPFDGREIALTHPSRNILATLGIWQRFPEEEIHHLREAKVINGTSEHELHFPLPQTNGARQAIDTLGYLVSNHTIRRAAYTCVRERDDIEWRLARKVVRAESNAREATVELDDGEVLRAPLLIAADSRFSTVRRQMGIPTKMHDYGRTVFVFRLEHELGNDHTACECFFYGNTLALLPLTDRLSNCVMTIDTRKRALFDNMDEAALAEHVSCQLGHRFGKMRMASTIHDYPLVGVHAKRFYAERCALIGDAACGTHPVTAHGFNLGLKSQAILSHLLLRQSGQGKDIGETSVLEAYNRRHRKNTLPLYYGTNLIVALFTRETAPARWLRDAVVHLGNNLPPLKKLITRQLTG